MNYISAGRKLARFRKPVLKAYTRFVKPTLRKWGASKTFSKFGKPFAKTVRFAKKVYGGRKLRYARF